MFSLRRHYFPYFSYKFKVECNWICKFVVWPRPRLFQVGRASLLVGFPLGGFHPFAPPSTDHALQRNKGKQDLISVLQFLTPVSKDRIYVSQEPTSICLVFSAFRFVMQHASLVSQDTRADNTATLFFLGTSLPLLLPSVLFSLTWKQYWPFPPLPVCRFVLLVLLFSLPFSPLLSCLLVCHVFAAFVFRCFCVVLCCSCKDASGNSRTNTCAGPLRFSS